MKEIIFNETINFYNKNVKPKLHNSDNVFTEKMLKRHKIFYNCNEYFIIDDLKWKDNKKQNIHLLAILKDKNLRSIRDLKKKNISLLNKINKSVLSIIKSKFNINSDQIISYFHYYPSIYQLHLHFVNINKKDNYEKELIIGRAHLLQNVINNIKNNSKYYQTMNLIVLVDEKKLNNFKKK